MRSLNLGFYPSPSREFVDQKFKGYFDTVSAPTEGSADTASDDVGGWLHDDVGSLKVNRHGILEIDGDPCNISIAKHTNPIAADDFKSIGEQDVLNAGSALVNGRGPRGFAKVPHRACGCFHRIAKVELRSHEIRTLARPHFPRTARSKVQPSDGVGGPISNGFHGNG